MQLPRFFKPRTFLMLRVFVRELTLTRKALERIAGMQELDWAERHRPPLDLTDGSEVVYRDNTELAELLQVESDLVAQYGKGRVTDDMVVAEWETRRR
jgi:hypothetical protein